MGLFSSSSSMTMVSALVDSNCFSGMVLVLFLAQRGSSLLICFVTISTSSDSSSSKIRGRLADVGRKISSSPDSSRVTQLLLVSFITSVSVSIGVWV